MSIDLYCLLWCSLRYKPDTEVFRCGRRLTIVNVVKNNSKQTLKKCFLHGIHFTCIYSFSLTTTVWSLYFIIFIHQRRKLRHREVNWFAYGPTAGRRCCQCSIPELPSSVLWYVHWNIYCVPGLYTYIISFTLLQSSEVDDMILTWQKKKLSLRQKKWQCQYSDSGETGYKTMFFTTAPHCLREPALVSFWGA